MVITCNYQILAWTVLLRHCFGSHSEGCLHVPFRPMSLGEKKGRKTTRLSRRAISKWQDNGICTPSIFQSGCCLNPKGWCFLAPQTSSMKAARKEDSGMCLVCLNFWSLVVMSFCPSRKGYPIDFPLAYHSSTTWKLPLGPRVFEGEFWMFQLFKNGFLMLPKNTNGAPKYIMTFYTFLKDAPKIYHPVI